ncbi:MAG: methylated-DNA--[protein]-cysteine S-methyltransferase [Erysipelotrichia bacterium]|nr:methylated-DNA--[protein]-cysteine S-methyltransferase [Erysipelotrichia bacterium]
MEYKSYYKTKGNFSDIVMFSDGKYLTGLYFVGYKMLNKLEKESNKKDLIIFKETKRWLDIYFKGEIPNFNIDYKIGELTPFRKEVLEILLKIPYGETVSYGKIAKEIALKHNKSKMSAQAVGGAVGHNPISIIIPCHRVIGSDGSITGYGGGIDNKIELLKLEKVIVDNNN